MQRRFWLVLLTGLWLAPALAAAPAVTEVPLLVLHSGKHSEANGRTRSTPAIEQLVEQLGQQANIRFRLLPTPWNRAVTMALAGEAGIYGISRTDERAARLRYSERVWREEVLLVTRRDRQFNFRSIDDLRGKRVSIPLGTSYDDGFEQAKHTVFTVEENPGGVQARLKQLLVGRADVAVYGNGRAKLAAVLAKMRGGDQLVALPTPLTFNDRYFAFPPTILDDAALARLNRAIRDAKARGDIARWLATPDPQDRPTSPAND